MTMNGGNLGPYVVPRLRLMTTAKRRMRKKQKGGAYDVPTYLPTYLPTVSGRPVDVTDLAEAAIAGTRAGLRKLTGKRKKRKGGALPLAAIVPGLIAAGKTAGLSALGGAASLATQAGLKRLTRRKRKKPAMR